MGRVNWAILGEFSGCARPLGSQQALGAGPFESLHRAPTPGTAACVRCVMQCLTLSASALSLIDSEMYGWSQYGIAKRGRKSPERRSSKTSLTATSRARSEGSSLRRFLQSAIEPAESRQWSGRTEFAQAQAHGSSRRTPTPTPLFQLDCSNVPLAKRPPGGYPLVDVFPCLDDRARP